MMQARDVMSEVLFWVESSATLYEAAKLLVNSKVSALPVVDEHGVMVGILSEADILKSPLLAAKKIGTETLGRPEDNAYADAALAEAKAQRVSAVMTKGVIAAHETASLREVADLMLKHKIKRVPIVRDGAILGIVSRVDLLKALISVGVKVHSPQPTSPLTVEQQLRDEIRASVNGLGGAVAQWFDVVVLDGVAHLWGVVPNDAVRQAHADAARKVPGVKSLVNHMHVGRAAGGGMLSRS
jgi:CBS domain-containing protein